MWIRIQQEFGIDDPGGLVLLDQVARSLQLARTCREEIARVGLMVGDKPHPLHGVMRDAEKQAAASLRQMNLDIEPLRDGPGRPPGAASKRR